MKVYIVIGGCYYEGGYHVLKCFASKDAAERYKSSISMTVEKYDYVKIIERDIHDDWMVPVD